MLSFGDEHSKYKSLFADNWKCHLRNAKNLVQVLLCNFLYWIGFVQPHCHDTETILQICVVVYTEHHSMSWWRHQMENFSASLVFGMVIHRSRSPHKRQSCGAKMFSFICAWTNGWVSNRDASDLRRHRAHYDVTVMYFSQRHSCLCGWARSQPLKKLPR